MQAVNRFFGLRIKSLAHEVGARNRTVGDVPESWDVFVTYGFAIHPLNRIGLTHLPQSFDPRPGG